MQVIDNSTATASVLEVLARVDDPEYPGVSIVDLGLVESVDVDGGRVTVGLIPTFLGCPALAIIRTDVERALDDAGWPGAAAEFLHSPVWTPERITDAGRAALGEGFTVAVQVGERSPPCPRCGVAAVRTTALFGSMRCRSVARCDACGEPLEVIR
ncbi:MAG: phenylacetate-CoA oxygenase subunit PaaJ [Actinomycetota bacterium]|nr:phenylacetate-CoA oxygenase subunit PaaJ [Actinomycetota bacterium]